MAVLVFLSALAAVSSFVLAPFAVRISRTLGAIDTPDGVRKLHTFPMPKLGGFGIYFSFFVSMTALFCFGSELTERLGSALLIGGAAAVFVGAADDIFSFQAFEKLSLGGLISLTVSLYMTDISDFDRPVPCIFRLFGNALFILMMMNAYNMVDGSDGLCATLALVPLFFMSGNPAALLLFFSVLGFLPYNLPAVIYLGESGAGLLGFLTAVIFIWGGTDAVALGGMLPFLAELTGTVIRRAASFRHPFSSDRGHIHHRLLSLGLNPHCVAALLGAISLLAGGVVFLVRVGVRAF